MARIEVTEESLRTIAGEDVFAQAVALAAKVRDLCGGAAGRGDRGRRRGQHPSARRPGRALRLPGGGPCPHAIAAVLTWVRAGPDLAAELRAELDDVLDELAAEAGDCDPDDGWYPDTGELEDLLDEVEDLAGGRRRPRGIWPDMRPNGSGRCWTPATA